MFYKILFSTLMAVFLVACNSQVKTDGPPAWIDKPGAGQVVGKCSTHAYGRNAQEECAYQNALTYMAMSRGVSVDITADTTMRQSSGGLNDSNYGQLDANMKLQQKNIKISARIVDKWHDRVRDIIYVLVEEN